MSNIFVVTIYNFSKINLLIKEMYEIKDFLSINNNYENKILCINPIKCYCNHLLVLLILKVKNNYFKPIFGFAIFEFD